MKNLDWQARALCRDYDPDVWFPSGVGHVGAKEARAAQAICKECPVIGACGEYADSFGKKSDIVGVFAGRNYVAKKVPVDEMSRTCGSEAAYKQHARRGEDCGVCRTAASLASRERRIRAESRTA